MTKERVILAFAAIIAGLIVASSIFYFYQQKKPSLQTPQSATPEATGVNNKPILEIESPEDESITDQKTAAVKGKTLPGTLVVISTNSDDFVVTSDNDGNFNQQIGLDTAENLITVSAYPENGASETKELTLTFTTEEF
jgi:hypothetical protein